MKSFLPTIITVIFLFLIPLPRLANSDDLDKIGTEKSRSLIIPTFTLQEQNWLNKKQPITYVYDPDWAPFEWKNDIDMHTGISADILNIIRNKTGINFIPVNTETWAESVKLVKSSKADMFSAITQNSDREKYLNFTSKDIYSYPAVLVTQFDDKTVYLDIKKDFINKRIGIVKSSGLGNYIKERYPELDYTELPSTLEGFLALRKNKIDLFAINTVTAKYFIEKKGFHDLKIAIKLDYTYHLKIATNKNLPTEVISILDKSLNSIREDQLNDIFNKWTEISIEKRTDWKLVAQIISVFLFTLLFFIWNTRRLNLMVDHKTKDLKTEIEERKQIEQELRDSEIKFRSLSDAAFEGIVISAKGIILEANDTLCKFMGYHPSELCNKAATDLISPEERENVKSKMLSGFEEPYETRVLKKDGSVFPVEVHGKMFIYKGRQVRVTAIRDLSERKQAEEEIKRLKGILPICASCKKIRDDKGYWNQIEAYIREHSEAEFSHGICPECAKRLYPGFYKENHN